MKQRKTPYATGMLMLASLAAMEGGGIDLPDVKIKRKEITEKDVQRELEAIRKKKANKARKKRRRK